MPERERRDKEKEEPSLKEVADYYSEQWHRLLPEDFKSHMRAARKEMLLAVRSLIDDRIESIEERERRRASRRPTRVPVE